MSTSLAEVRAVGQHVEHDRLAVLAGAELLHLAVRQQEELVGRLPCCDDHVAGVELLLGEPVGERRQRVVVGEVPQQRQLAQLRGTTRTSAPTLTNDSRPSPIARLSRRLTR